MLGVFIFIVLPLALMWLLVIRPQRQRAAAQQALVAAIGVGDEVMISAGIIGTVEAFEENERLMRLTVAPNVTLRVAREAIIRRMDDDVPGPPPLSPPGPVED